MRWIGLLLALVASLVAQADFVHEVRPAYLKLQQTAPDTYERWRRGTA
jgi:hypothetical protein